jgi:hypothetical protein
MFEILEELKKEKPSQYVIKNLIRKELCLDNESHYRWIVDKRNQFRLSENHRKGLAFEMSGYDNSGNGSCHAYNQYLLNHFVNGLDLSKNMRFFSLDFYKGGCEFIYEYWEDHKNGYTNEKVEQWCGDSTSTIIYQIIEICLINNKPKHDRRRS